MKTHSSPTSTAAVASRKTAAIEFIQSAASGKVDKAFTHTAPQFRHHNPWYMGDAKSLSAAMAQIGETLDVQFRSRP